MSKSSKNVQNMVDQLKKLYAHALPNLINDAEEQMEEVDEMVRSLEEEIDGLKYQVEELESIRETMEVNNRAMWSLRIKIDSAMEDMESGLTADPSDLAHHIAMKKLSQFQGLADDLEDAQDKAALEFESVAEGTH